MRYLGLALVTAIAVVVLAGNTQPSTNQASDVEVPTHTPHWNGIYAATFPGCVGAGSFIPARIVVVPREGEARLMRYTDRSVARIDATWDNQQPADDLFTIGKCR